MNKGGRASGSNIEILVTEVTGIMAGTDVTGIMNGIETGVAGIMADINNGVTGIMVGIQTGIMAGEAKAVENCATDIMASKVGLQETQQLALWLAK